MNARSDRDQAAVVATAIISTVTAALQALRPELEALLREELATLRHHLINEIRERTCD
jgi:hypothetical protein